MTSKLRAPKVCPVCGEDVPRVALACPECGADHTSGWRENAEAYDAVDLPDEDFNYEEFVKQEFGSSRRPVDQKTLVDHCNPPYCCVYRDLFLCCSLSAARKRPVVDRRLPEASRQRLRDSGRPGGLVRLKPETIPLSKGRMLRHNLP